jgi:hypothetical protein
MQLNAVSWRFAGIFFFFREKWVIIGSHWVASGLGIAGAVLKLMWRVRSCPYTSCSSETQLLIKIPYIFFFFRGKWV